MNEAIRAQASVIGGLSRALRRRYMVLFYSLLLTMLTVPASGVLRINPVFIELFLAANLLIAVMPLETKRARRILLFILMILWAARLATIWLHDPVLAAITLGTWTIVGLLAAASALRFVMRARLVEKEHLYAALSAYLLAGIFLGHFYWALEQIWPGSFAFPGDFSRMSALYFSFVTLATLGYGDILPRSDVARGLAIVEGVGGQLFLAVLIARLVSLYGTGKEAN
jgi:voltage-gated potassium channel Kch